MICFVLGQYSLCDFFFLLMIFFVILFIGSILSRLSNLFVYVILSIYYYLMYSEFVLISLFSCDLFVCFIVLGFELRALYLLGRLLYSLSHSSSPDSPVFIPNIGNSLFCPCY
jgi:hypothetical protein